MFKIRKILVPVDFSACSRQALEHALSISELTSASVDLLHVWEPPHFEGHAPRLTVEGEPTSLSEYAVNVARAEMSNFLTGLPPEVLTHVSQIYDVGAPRERVLERARHGYDLIVMGTHGRTGRQHALAGSVAESTIRLAPCPVLTVRAAG
jgi:nucleotide-binding universal stress UspA family protein